MYTLAFRVLSEGFSFDMRCANNTDISFRTGVVTPCPQGIGARPTIPLSISIELFAAKRGKSRGRGYGRRTMTPLKFLFANEMLSFPILPGFAVGIVNT